MGLDRIRGHMNGLTATLLKQWEELRNNYWFVPTVMSLGAVLLAIASSAADQWLLGALGDAGKPPLSFINWLYVNDPDGARAFLSIVAGSLIGVAGVTFSVTIAAVAYTAAAFGPRLLTNFLGDRGNQFTLGTFIATFLYCVLILRTVSSETDNTPAFIPHISIMLALLLAIVSVAMLIFFLNHVPKSIHISNLIASIGGNLCLMIETRFPWRDDKLQTPDEHPLPDDFGTDAFTVTSEHDGYLRNMAYDVLVETARTHDLILRLEKRVGEFAHKGQVLVLAWPAGHVTEDAANRIRHGFAWGTQRTRSQDPMFLINELVEIAARALSPAVNDPFTACACVDWLRSALTRLARRGMPETAFRDGTGTLRLVAPPEDYERYVRAAFERLRPYFSADTNATCHMLHAMESLAPALREHGQREVVATLADNLGEAAFHNIDIPSDQARIERRLTAVRVALHGSQHHPRRSPGRGRRSA